MYENEIVLCIFMVLHFFFQAASLCESESTKAMSFFPQFLYFESLGTTHVMRTFKEMLIVHIIARPALYN